PPPPMARPPPPTFIRPHPKIYLTKKSRRSIRNSRSENINRAEHQLANGLGRVLKNHECPAIPGVSEVAPRSLLRYVRKCHERSFGLRSNSINVARDSNQCAP